MTSVKLELVNRLRALEANLKQQEDVLKTGVDHLEDGKKTRDIKRKEIMLNEVKKVLSNLHETDKNLVKELKSEVFDQLRAMNKVEKEVNKLIETVKVTDNQDVTIMMEAVMEVQSKVEGLQLDHFSR